jgi:ABC-2 type transport system permease protein
MIRDLVLLVSLSFQVSWNRFWRMKLWRKLLNIGLLGIFGISVGFVSGVIGMAAGSLLKRYPQFQLESLLPGLLLTAIALLMVISSFGLALGSLFFSRDLELLMSAPVNRRAVFISKILGGFGSYYALVFLLAVPGLITYGIGLRYGPLYYFFMLLAVLGTPLLPAGLGALLVLLVARVAPVRRVREVLGLVAALFGSSCALLGNTTQLWMRQITTANASLEGILTWVKSIANLPIPSMVAGYGLVAAGEGNLLAAVGLMAGFWAITFGFFAGCIWLADRMYATGWMRMQGAGEAKRKVKSNDKAAQRDLLSRAAPYFAIALKDWRIIPRDLRNFAQFLSPLFFIPLIYVQLFVNTGGRSGKSMSQMINQWGTSVSQGSTPDVNNIILAGTILMSTIFVFARIAQMGISMEGRSYWILKIAPVPGRELLLGKFVAAMVPFTILSTLLLIIAAVIRGFTPFGFLYGWLCTQMLGAGMLVMDVGLAVPWANLEWDDPRKMNSGWGGLIAMLGYILIGGLGGLCLTLPYIAESISFISFLAPVAWVVGPFLAVGITGCTAGTALWLGLSRLRKVGEA